MKIKNVIENTDLKIQSNISRIYYFKKGMIPWNKKSPIKKVCLNCSNVFFVQPYRKTAEFCSRKCHNLYRKGKSTYRQGLSLEEEYGIEKAKEIRKKLSEAKRGRKLIERWGPERYFQWREIMKETFSGSKNPNFGKIPKHLVTWSKSMKGKTLEEMYGKEIGEREQERRATQLRTFAKKWRGKKLIERYGPERAKEIVENMSKISKRLWKESKLKLSSTVFKKGQIPPNKGKKWEEIYSPAQVKHLKELRRKYALEQGFPRRNTRPEALLYNELESRKIEFKKQYPVLNLCRPDAVLEKQKIAIFCDGDYFHANPNRTDFNPNKLTKVQLHNIERDKFVNQKLSENGWNVLRFWEFDIKRDIKGCVDKIEETSKLTKGTNSN